MKQEQQIFLNLIHSGLSGEKAEVTADFDWENALLLAKKHNLLTFIYYVIKNSLIKIPSEVAAMLDGAFYKNTLIDCNQMYEAQALVKMFREEGVDFSLLKGLHLKKCFPQSVMRSMSDLDILVRTEQLEKVKEMIQPKGYKFETETDHVTEWSKGDYIHLELHKKLVPRNQPFGEYYADSWRFFKPVEEGSNEYAMSPSDEYIFLFLHFAKHYISGGVGIRQMLDLWVFSSNDIDYSYVERQLETLSLAEFWKNIRATLDCWMNGADSTEKTDFITDFIFSSGVFGNHHNYLIANAVKSNEKPEHAGKRRIFELFILPYSGMCIKYPVLKKYPVLLPFYWVKRLVTAFFFNRKKGIIHLKEFSKMDGKEIKAAKSDFNYVGLDFNFKE